MLAANFLKSCSIFSKFKKITNTEQQCRSEAHQEAAALAQTLEEVEVEEVDLEAEEVGFSCKNYLYLLCGNTD
jgi:vacuolar-type H+-ATPase subunit D/Vma8